MTFRAASAWILVLSLVVGCRRESTATRPTTATTVPSAATESIDGGSEAPQSADQILQARLVRAVREMDDTIAAREPEPPMTMIGLVNESTGKPKLRQLATNVSGRLPPEVIQRIVRQNFGRFRLCYEQGLKKKKDLAGKVVSKFTIARDGSVTNVKSTGDLPDASVMKCVERSFWTLSFPQPEGGIVVVTYPIAFEPTDTTAAPSATPPPPPPPPPTATLSIAPSAAPSAAPPPPEGPWPIVVIEGESITMDGVTIASTRAILELSRLQRVDTVFSAMKAAREKWKEAHPGAAFPGVAGLRAPLDAPMVVVKSVFQTMAFAGFPNLLLQVASERNRIIDLSAIVPGPPVEGVAVAPREPTPVLHVYFDSDDSKLVWKRAATVVSDEKTTEGELGAAICKSWSAQGAHRDAADPVLDHLVIHGDNQRTFTVVAALSKALDSCTRARRDRSGAERRVPTFWMSLSVN